MLDETKQTAQRLSIKNKVLTISCMLAIMLSLFLVCYLFFFRSITIDLSADMEVIYEGESGSATVSVLNHNKNINQRTQEFLDSIQYQVTPNQNLSNGSVIQIVASYDHSLATKYHIQVVNETKEVSVEGLAERFSQAADINQEYQEFLTTTAQNFFDRNMEWILNEDFANFSDGKMELVNQERIYRVFLKSMSLENRDKILDVYQITAKQDAKEYTINYFLVYDGVNSKKELKDENIYGEKVITDTVLGIDGSINKDGIIHSQEDLESALWHKYLYNYTYELVE